MRGLLDERWMFRLLAGLMLVTLSTWTMAAEPLGTPDEFDILFPDDEPAGEDEVLLGKTLFFDPRLSRQANLSCAGCHDPELGFGDGRPFSRGTEGNLLSRHTPSLYNLAWNVTFMWDGRAGSLEQQAVMPIGSDQEMNLPAEEMLSRLRAVPWYRTQFARVYGDAGITTENVSLALAAFQRTLVVDDTPFDRYLAGEEAALSAAARRGLALFRGRADCVQCHDGPNFTDESFHNIGHCNATDAGRGGFTGESTLHGAFKTPGLRNVALSAPYLHDGSLETLEDVVQFYNRGGDCAEGRSRLIRPLGLNEREVADLVAFMNALTEPLEVEPPPIPVAER